MDRPWFFGKERLACLFHSRYASGGCKHRQTQPNPLGFFMAGKGAGDGLGGQTQPSAESCRALLLFDTPMPFRLPYYAKYLFNAHGKCSCDF